MSEKLTIPPSWVQCVLGDVVDYGATAKAEPDEVPSDAWILELEDIEKDTSKLLQRVSFAERNSKSTKNRFEAGDVLYGKLRPYLNKVILADRAGYCTTEILPLRPPEGVSSSFLFYWLRHPSFLEYVTAVSHGLNMPRLGTEAGRAAPLVLAPSGEQRRIADKLDTLLARVDACRERLDRVPGILRRFRQAVLTAATSGELTREWRDQESREFDWRQVSVGSLLTDIRYGTSKKCEYEPRQVPVLRIPNIADGTVSLDDLKFAEFEDDEIRKLALAPGDVLMIRSNGSLALVGQTALVTERERGFLYAGYLIRLRPNPDLVNPAYLALALASPSSRKRIELTARSTTGVNNINAEEIRSFTVPLPPLAEQDEIVRRQSELRGIEDSLRSHIERVQAMVDRSTPAILAKAFRGELVQQDPNDEPASELLARLKASTVRPRATSPTRQTTDPRERKPSKEPGSMSKTRNDEDVRNKPYLARHLRTLGGTATAEQLYRASELGLADFYKQLSWELDQDHIRDLGQQLGTT